ncbi:MAG TPA: two-component regulator propeller domain-containing protein [bacterium]|nr:two-component regulator propeller domain-containing protein [bacterium]HPG46611.1 two-component regulator propeller domain-containing protein [bacterium]HPM98333.1 two-component regulator propeller domain-containing protein [bacterium]
MINCRKLLCAIAAFTGCAFALLAAPERIFAQAGEWKTFTHTGDVRRFAVGEEAIWCATNGGLLRFDRQQSNFSVITNTEGLAGNDLVAVTVDQRNRVWVATAEGNLNILDPVSAEWIIKNDYRKVGIRDLLAFGDSIFVSLSIGVSLYDVSKSADHTFWETKETWHVGETNRTTIIGREIWLATENGIKRNSLDYPNLKDPAMWQLFTVQDGLPDNHCYFVKRIADQILSGTDKGLALFNGSRWQVIAHSGLSVTDAVADGQGFLTVATSAGVFTQIAADAWQLRGPALNHVKQVNTDRDGQLWMIQSDLGLARFATNSNAWESFRAGGPVSNAFSALAVDRDGNLWASSPNPGGGISRFDGSSWTTYARRFWDPQAPSHADDFRALAVDSSNRIWAASWGGGVTIIDPNSDPVSYTVLDATNNRLSGIPNDLNYVVTTGLVADLQGNMWILNREAANRNVLAVVSPENRWQYFSTSDGIGSLAISALAIDNAGRKWIGTADRGIKVLEDGGTIFNKADDDLSQGLTTSDGLQSMAIQSLAVDSDGVVWVGTPEGLNYWFQGQVGVRFSVINDDITTLMVDTQNNKWLGTSGGFSRLANDSFTWEHFSTSNSPLVSDRITSFAMNHRTGELYIGTTNGLSRLQTTYARPEKSLDLVKGYPNPFIISGPNPRFVIDRLAAQASVSIYTPEGVLVRKIPESQVMGSQAVWDGKNNHQEFVASGIYLYLVTAQGGQSAVGKVAVVRP